MPRQRESEEPVTEQRSTALASAAIGTLTLGWFGVSRWALGSPVVDAAGEAAGGVMTLLLLVSVVGSLRRSRR
jgi:hypothetical protein